MSKKEKGAEGQSAIDVIPCLNRYPLQTEGAPRLLYPQFMSLVPLVSCADTNLNFLSGDDIFVPRRGRVYFEIIQGCWKTIYLFPSVVAVIVEPESEIKRKLNTVARIGNVGVWVLFRHQK